MSAASYVLTQPARDVVSEVFPDAAKAATVAGLLAAAEVDTVGALLLLGDAEWDGVGLKAGPRARLKDRLGRLRVEMGVVRAEDTTAAAVGEMKRLVERAEMREAEPWRTQQQRATRERAVLTAIPTKDRQKQFILRAKDRNLTPMEMICGTYLIFGTEDDKAFFSAVLLQKGEAERTVAHNWFVAEKSGPDFLLAHGALIGRLRLPLFPWVDVAPELFMLNNEMIRAEEVAHGGGANGRQGTERFFRTAPQGGDPWLPVTAHEGGYAIDGAPIQQGMAGNFVLLQKEIEELRREVRQHRGRGGYNPQHQGRGGQQQQQAYRGANRGRGRGTYRPSGKGEDEIDEKMSTAVVPFVPTRGRGAPRGGFQETSDFQ